MISLHFIFSAVAVSTAVFAAPQQGLKYVDYPMLEPPIPDLGEALIGNTFTEFSNTVQWKAGKVNEDCKQVFKDNNLELDKIEMYDIT
jgi:hypothetical protein